MSASQVERRTRRLTVRALRRDDRNEFVRVFDLSRELHSPWSPRLPNGWTGGDVFAVALARAMTGTTWKGVGVLDDGRIGGFFNLNEIVRGAFHCAYAGWSINAEVAGQGIATEGVGALLDLALSDPPEGLGLHRVQANIVPRNRASIRVAEKNHMRFEGVAQRYLRIAGAWEDHAMYALTAEEWPPKGLGVRTDLC